MSQHFLLFIDVPPRKLEFTALGINQIVLTHNSLEVLLQKHAGNWISLYRGFFQS